MSRKTAGLDETQDGAYAIKSALDYLYVEAVNANLRLVAHLIGAASEAVDLHQSTANDRRNGSVEKPN